MVAFFHLFALYLNEEIIYSCYTVCRTADFFYRTHFRQEMNALSVIISRIEPHSLAQRAGIAAGERLISINGFEINDILDYRYYETERTLCLVLESDGRQRSVKITKGEYQPIGLEFATYLMDKQRSCKNKCIFCFVDQTPKGMRESLYFKDDDERLSFLFGNYITLTNLTDHEVERIIKMRISPVNVSVHTTNPELRVSMMKNPAAARIMELLGKLAEGGIQINCQLVLCPGINDGPELERSLNDLIALAPQVHSIALVPVGLTRHREGLPELRTYTPEQAGQVIDTAHEYAAKCWQKFGSMVVWAADEFYLTAGRELLTDEHYEDYPQLDNGVGMITLLRTEFASAVENTDGDDLPHCATIATGVSAAPILDSMLDSARQKWKNARWNVVPIINHFFGEQITVAGLVTGTDLLAQLDNVEINGRRLLIPSVMLRHEGDMFLDSITTEQVSEQLGADLIPVANDGWELLDALLGTMPE